MTNLLRGKLAHLCVLGLPVTARPLPRLVAKLSITSNHRNMIQYVRYWPQIVRALALAAIVGLSACATPEDMRAGPPTATLLSKRIAADVATCIADRWENETILGAPVAHSMRVRATSTGHSVIVSNQSGIGYMADVLVKGAGSAINYYDNHSPNKAVTGLRAVQGPERTQPNLSGMHTAVIECSR